MAATFTDAGLDLIGKWILGITPLEDLAVIVFNNESSPDPNATFDDFVPTPLPGGGPTALNPSMWGDASFAGQGDFTYPVITYTYTSSGMGDVLTGYLVYSVLTQTPLWYEVFNIAQVIPPTGGAAFLNLEFIDLTST